MQTYQAILVHPHVAGQRCSGMMHIDNGRIYFTSDEITYTIAVINLRLTSKGAGNQYIFLSNRDEHKIFIYTSDNSVLQHPSIVSDPDLRQDVSNSAKFFSKARTILILVLVLLALSITGIYLIKDSVIKVIANQVPAKWEQQAGDKLFSGLAMQYQFIHNDSLKQLFLKTGAPLFGQVEKLGCHIDLYFVKDPAINAFALPGGKVIVQTGLISSAGSWEEVMGVLSHELAHVTERHHIRGIINNIGIYTLVSAFVGDVSALAATVINAGGNLASLSNSRSFEREADERGWDYLVEAQINPEGLIDFFETLEKHHKTGIDTTMHKTADLSFLSTHPDTQKRINYLKEKAKRYNGKSTPLPSDFEKFKEALLQIE